MLNSGERKEQCYEDAACGSLGISHNWGHLSYVGLMLQYNYSYTEFCFIQTDDYSYFGTAVFHI